MLPAIILSLLSTNSRIVASRRLTSADVSNDALITLPLLARGDVVGVAALEEGGGAEEEENEEVEEDN